MAKTFNDIRGMCFGGLMITGTPAEQLPFEEADCRDELCAVMEQSNTNMRSVFPICWGTQVGLY